MYLYWCAKEHTEQAQAFKYSWARYNCNRQQLQDAWLVLSIRHFMLCRRACWLHTGFCCSWSCRSQLQPLKTTFAVCLQCKVDNGQCAGRHAGQAQAFTAAEHMQASCCHGWQPLQHAYLLNLALTIIQAQGIVLDKHKLSLQLSTGKPSAMRFKCLITHVWTCRAACWTSTSCHCSWAHASLLQLHKAANKPLHLRNRALSLWCGMWPLRPLGRISCPCSVPLGTWRAVGCLASLMALQGQRALLLTAALVFSELMHHSFSRHIWQLMTTFIITEVIHCSLWGARLDSWKTPLLHWSDLCNDRDLASCHGIDILCYCTPCQ